MTPHLHYMKELHEFVNLIKYISEVLSTETNAASTMY